MEPYSTESFNSNYLKENMSEYTNILIIPILEKHHWFSIVCYLNEKVIICLDSMFLEIKLKSFLENTANNIPTFSSCKY